MHLKDCHILVTATSYGKNDPSLKSDLERQVARVVYNPYGKPLTSQQLCDLLPGIDGLIAGLDTIDAAALRAADRLKVIARYGVGVDNVDRQAAVERGIVVTNTPGANSSSVAELALLFMLALARQLVDGSQAVRAGHWPRLSGVSLDGKAIGILGLGAIGKCLARMLAGWNVRIFAYDPRPDTEFAAAHQVELCGLDELLPLVDFVSLHLPLLPETRGMVNEKFLMQMKPGAFLINTSRGEIVDEAALQAALHSGRLRGAGLDAFCVEPPPADHPLLAMPQVIASPHLGAQTDGATNLMGRMALNDCLAVLEGRPPRYKVE